MIPDFLADGYLPAGLHLATKSEVLIRFGSSTRRRQRLALRLQRWLELGRSIGAKRFLLDGSFVTSIGEPNDVDAVIWLPTDFASRVSHGDLNAIELETMLLTRHPEEIFAAEDRRDWNEWVEFFSRTREDDFRRKGLVEVKL